MERGMEQAEFGRALRELREQAGYRSQSQLARACGVDNSTLARLERGETRPTLDTLKRLAPCLGVPYEELLAAAGYLAPSEEERAEKGHRVPILGAVRTGLPLLAEENFEGELEVPADVRADFALRVQGDSMIGVGIHEGDYAICRQAQAARPGEIVVALHDVASGFSEATLKYFFRDPERGPVLRAANPEYEDIVLDEAWRLAGVVVAILKKEPPAYAHYSSYISTRDFHLREWDRVIAEAAQCGVRPGQVLEIIRMQWQMARRLFERQERYRGE